MYQTLMRKPWIKLWDLASFHDIAIPKMSSFEGAHKFKHFLVIKLLRMKEVEEIPLKDVTGKWRV